MMNWGLKSHCTKCHKVPGFQIDLVPPSPVLVNTTWTSCRAHTQLPTVTGMLPYTGNLLRITLPVTWSIQCSLWKQKSCLCIREYTWHYPSPSLSQLESEMCHWAFHFVAAELPQQWHPPSPRLQVSSDFQNRFTWSGLLATSLGPAQAAGPDFKLLTATGTGSRNKFYGSQAVSG
jgi:hypothetical protein